MGDGIVLDPCDVQFDIIWRAQDGDHVVSTVTHHFDPQPTGFDAVKFETDLKGSAINPTIASDQLVLRFSTQTVVNGASIVYIPNSDGAHANGRIPSITYPR